MLEEDTSAVTATADPQTDPGTAASEPTAETSAASAGAASAENPADAASTTSSSTAETRSQVPPPNAGQPANGARPGQAAPEPNWQEQYKHLERLYGRQAQELGQHRKLVQSYEGLPAPDELRRQFDAQRQQAEMARIKPWNPRHPEHIASRSRIDRAANYFAAVDAATAGLPEDQARSVAAKIAKSMGVTAQDAQLHQEYEAHKTQVQDRLASDFDGLFDEYFESRFNARMQQYEQYQQSRHDTQAFIQGNQDVLEKHRDEVLWAMQHPNRRDVAVRLAQVEEENARLRAQMSSRAEDVETAKAQTQATKQRATFRRDGATQTVADPAAEAVKQGLRGDNAFDYLLKHRGAS